MSLSTTSSNFAEALLMILLWNLPVDAEKMYFAIWRSWRRSSSSNPSATKKIQIMPLFLILLWMQFWMLFRGVRVTGMRAFLKPMRMRARLWRCVFCWWLNMEVTWQSWEFLGFLDGALDAIAWRCMYPNWGYSNYACWVTQKHFFGGIEVSRQPLSWIVSSSMTSVCLWLNSHVIFLRAKPIMNERGGKWRAAFVLFWRFFPVWSSFFQNVQML